MKQCSPEKFAADTRKLQILVGEFNALLKWALWGFLIVLMCTAIFAICGAVWDDGGRKMHMTSIAVFMTVLINIIYTKLASLFEVSEAVLTGWRRGNALRPWFPRFLRSTPPLRVLIGSYFYADKELVLTTMGIIADNSVTLLVSRRS